MDFSQEILSVDGVLRVPNDTGVPVLVCGGEYLTSAQLVNHSARTTTVQHCTPLGFPMTPTRLFD